MEISGIWQDKPTTIGGLVVATGLTVAVELGWLSADAAVGIQSLLVAALAALLNSKKPANDAAGPGAGQ